MNNIKTVTSFLVLTSFLSTSDAFASTYAKGRCQDDSDEEIYQAQAAPQPLQENPRPLQEFQGLPTIVDIENLLRVSTLEISELEGKLQADGVARTQALQRLKALMNVKSGLIDELIARDQEIN